MGWGGGGTGGGPVMPAMKPVTPAALKPPSPLNPILWRVLSHLPLSGRHSAVNSSPSGSCKREREATGREKNRRCGRALADMDH